VCSKYRPRLAETETELRRRIADIAAVSALEGAVRVPQYTSAEMYAYASVFDLPRGSGRVLVWGGLRGGISVALALSLPVGPERETILGFTYVVVAFSILVQGLSIGWVVRKCVDRGAR